jgi:hypothetical protein
LFLTKNLRMSSRMAAPPKPTSGEIRSTLKTLLACSQSTPLVPVCGFMSWLAMPTPMMDPMSVWELEAGRPNHQVLRFQMMAAISNEKTMAKPAPLPTWRMSSTGSRDRMVKATAPEEVSTPIRFHRPDQTTATCGSRECV